MLATENIQCRSLSLSLSLSFSLSRLPVEVEDEFLEASSQKGVVSLSFGSSHLVDTEHSPCVHGRIDVIKGKLIGGDLAVGSHVPLPQEQNQLLFSELWVNLGKWDHVEGKVPRGILDREKTRQHGVSIIINYVT